MSVSLNDRSRIRPMKYFNYIMIIIENIHCETPTLKTLHMVKNIKIKDYIYIYNINNYHEFEG